MIEGGFNTASSFSVPAGDITLTSTPSIDAYLPLSKLAKGNYIYIYSYLGLNYFGLSGVSSIGGGGGNVYATLSGGGSLTVQEAANVDKKFDDGMPLTGKITALFLNCCGASGSGWTSASTFVEYSGFGGPASQAIFSWSGSCFNNNGVAGVQPAYNWVQNGNLTNCRLSFQFQ